MLPYALVFSVFPVRVDLDVLTREKCKAFFQNPDFSRKPQAQMFQIPSVGEYA